MRKLVITLGITLLLVLLALFIAPQFIPADTYKNQIVARVEAATGRDMSINGPIGLRLIPSVRMTLEDVRLENPENFGGAEGEPMVSLQELQISLGLLSMLQGDVVIEEFKLVEPVIALARNGRGEANWVFTPQEEVDTPTDTAKPDDTSRPSGDIQLPNLEIVDGALRYRATTDADPIGLSELNAKIQMPSLNRVMGITANTRWNGNVPVTLEAYIDTPSLWFDDKETGYELTLNVDGEQAVLKANGKANPLSASRKRIPVIDGETHLSVASLKKLGERLGMTLLPETMPGEGKLSLRSMFSYQDNMVKLQGTTLSLDAITISGSGAVKLDGARPLITADMASSDVLTLDDFMPQDEPTIRPPQKDAPQTGINAAGWSNEPIMADTSALKAVDADIALSIGGIKAEKIVLGAMQIRATLKNGLLTARVPDFPFYGGTAKAGAVVQAIGDNRLSLRKDATISNANIGQFLSDAYDFDRLAGKGDVSMDFSTRGSSVQDFVNALDGSGRFLLRNGAIRGFNLAETVREARTLVQSVKNKDFTADMRSEVAEDTVKTDFAELSGSFTINSGILSNRDLSLKAPLMTVTGQGTVDIPRKTVDYRLRPTLVGSIEGEGRTQQTQGGLTIPMRVTGNFDALKFTPDASGLVEEAIKNPEGTVENLEENFKGLRDDVKSLFKGL